MPDTLHITKLPDGGFVVHDMGQFPGAATKWLFASTSSVEALAYIKDKLDPKK